MSSEITSAQIHQVFLSSSIFDLIFAGEALLPPGVR